MERRLGKCESCDLSFIGGKMKTVARGNSLLERLGVGGVSVCVILMKRRAVRHTFWHTLAADHKEPMSS